MAAYDPQRNRSRRRPAESTDEPAAVDALLGPVHERDRSPEPVAVAVNDEVVQAAAEPLADLRAVPDPEPSPKTEAVPQAVRQPDPVVEPERDEDAHSSEGARPERAPVPGHSRSPAARIAAAVLAALAVLALLLAWARRRR